MGEGLPLPWPFPWSVSQNAMLASRSDVLKKITLTPHLQAASSPFGETVYAEATKLRAQFGASLPPISSTELYIIEGIAEVVLPGTMQVEVAVDAKKPAVIYPPEFLFVLDVGLDCRIGGVILWEPVGYGDPGFPENKAVHLRSVSGKTQGELIFPKIAGSLIIGLRDGTTEVEVLQELPKQGIQDIKFHTFFATGNCRPFEEPSVCAALESAVPFVKYAESNMIQRIIDFSPGWFAKRLL